MLKVIKFIIIISYLLLLIVITTLSALFFYYGIKVSEYSLNVSQGIPKHPNVVLSDDNTPLNIHNGQFYSYIAYKSIPQIVKEAFISAEDKNFFNHTGVDLVALIKAVVEYAFFDAKRLRGASTITQQLVKNIILQKPERTISRKVQEAIIAFEITRKIGKQQILELYLNNIYLGNHVYGIAQGARVYFNKSLSSITLNEAAYLAAIPKAPSLYNAFKNVKISTVRRDWVLKRMYINGFITLYDMQKAASVKLKPKSGNANYENMYFVDEVINQAQDILPNQKGLSVFTSLNTRMQGIAQNALKYGINKYVHGSTNMIARNVTLDRFRSKEKYTNPHHALVTEIQSKKIYLTKKIKGRLVYFYVVNNHRLRVRPGDVVLVEHDKDNNYSIAKKTKINGAVVISDIKTGNLLAMVGGESYRESQFNRAVKAHRQPGSLFKVLLASSALDHEFMPNDIILDIPVSIKYNGDYWEPSNYSRSYRGPVTIRTAVEKSLNLAIVNLAQDLGLKNIFNSTRALGMFSDVSTPLPSMSLGSYETTLIDIMYAYLAIINSGTYIKPHFISYIRNAQYQTVYRFNGVECKGCNGTIFDDSVSVNVVKKTRQVIDPRTSYQMIDIMRGVVVRGTGRMLSNIKGYIGGKSGTSNQGKDAWFIAFTPKYLIGVYMGYDRPMSLGSNASGSLICGPVIKKILQNIDTSGAFIMPPGLTRVQIDRRTGKIGQNSSDLIYEIFKNENLSRIKSDDNSYNYY